MRDRGGRRGGGGPIGLLVSLVGQGVGLAQEYKEHRKEVKESRSSSQQDVNAMTRDTARSSATPQHIDTEDAPPAYEEAFSGSEQHLQSGPPPTSDKKHAERWEGDASDQDGDDISIVDDAEDWELDEAGTRDDASGLPSFEEVERMDQGETVDDLVRDVLRDYRPLPSADAALSSAAVVRQPLPCPVIIPQRRPRNNTRGFVRAYAPVLEGCGIDQETFLKFLKNFFKASQACPVFPLIQLAAGITGFVPGVIAMAVSTAVGVAARVGEEMEVRVRTNNYLDRMNDEFFKPAGLYAIIIKYKSDTDVQQSSGTFGSLASMIQPGKVDITTNQSIAKYSHQESSDKSFTDRMRQLRVASGTTKGSIAMPEAAPLIFPAIDYQLKHDGPETFKDKKRDAGKFLADYLDRRAQMKYAQEDPDSALAQTQQQRPFKSSFADPNHPMYSGGLVSLVSGGKINLNNIRNSGRDNYARGGRRSHGRDDRFAGRRGYGDYDDQYYEGDAQQQYYGRGNPGEGSSSGAYNGNFDGGYRGGMGGRGTGGQGGVGPLGAVKRLMKKDVLYLMIVNMPSEAELQEAKEELARAKASR